MKIDCVLTAVNENELYIDFIPIFVETWNKLYPDIDVKIILIATNIPNKFNKYAKNIILFKPIKNILTSFISQVIRILYPCILNYENGIMITDIDILPMNRTYYTDNIKSYDNTKFIYFRENVCFEHQQIAMCYNVACPNIWKDIFKINTEDDIINMLIDINNNHIILPGHGNEGWCIDQIKLYENVFNWNKMTNNFICLNEKKTKFNRLDRNTFSLNDTKIINNIKNGVYCDYHCYRPMSKYSDVNYKIMNLL